MQSFSIKEQGYSHRLSYAGGAIMIVGSSMSISLVSLGGFLAVIGWIWEVIERRRQSSAALSSLEATDSIGWKIPAPFWWGLGLFGWLALSLLIRAVSAWSGHLDNSLMPSGDSSAFLWHLKQGWNKELKDAFLILAGLWTFSHSRDGRSRQWLLRCFFWAGIIMLVAGFISVFTQFRLAKIPQYMANDWQDSPDARLQHHVGSIPLAGKVIHLFMPIGLLNTHLTYAALAGIFILYLALSAASQYIRQPLGVLRSKSFWLRVIALLVLGLVLLLNSGRSALLGTALAGVLGLYWFTRSRWKKRARALWLPVGAVALILILGTLGLLVLDRSDGRMKEIATATTGEEKHTDYQRLMVWDAAVEMAARYPLTGVGPGAFEDYVELDILLTGKQEPYLYYPYALIQRGHAHNDLLNFAAIGGLPAVILFLCFWGSVILALMNSGGRARFWRFGLLIVFFGGWFQCFFLDDEVMVPFWALLGLIIPGKKRMTAESVAVKSE
tara:strand:- start:7552 stop:9045 length:1494 start_codon:yes stop_codon:yes gene_type:complete